MRITLSLALTQQAPNDYNENYSRFKVEAADTSAASFRIAGRMRNGNVGPATAFGKIRAFLRITAFAHAFPLVPNLRQLGCRTHRRAYSKSAQQALTFFRFASSSTFRG